MEKADGVILYLAGPMTGLPNMNAPAFFDAEERLSKLGFIVLNPARLPKGMPSGKYMPICLAMLQQSDGIALLPGWRDSKGANIEFRFAEYQNIKSLSLDTILSFFDNESSRNADGGAHEWMKKKFHLIPESG